MQKTLISNNVLNIITGCSNGLGKELCNYKKKIGENVIGFSRNLEKDNNVKYNFDICDYNNYYKKKYEFIENFNNFNILNFYFNAAYINDEDDNFQSIIDNTIESININFLNQLKILKFFENKIKLNSINVYFLSSVSVYNNKNNLIGYKLSKNLMNNFTKFSKNKKINNINLDIKCFVFGGILTSTYLNKIKNSKSYNLKKKMAITTDQAINILESNLYYKNQIIIKPLRIKIIYYLNKIFKLF